jgi:hypothetical protein
MSTSKIRRIVWAGVALGVAAGVIGAGIVGFRAHRVYRIVRSWQAEIRYLIQSGGTIGEAPAADTLSGSYLEAVFGSDPALLDKLKGVIAKGVEEAPSIVSGEIAAMIVSYHKNGDGGVTNVAVQIAGGFPIAKRKPGFHRDGFFASQMDHNLWQVGNTMIGFIGRDIVLFADEETSRVQEEVLEAILNGDVLPLVATLDKPLYFTAVFPDPRRIIPPQLRGHVQAFILKGRLGLKDGSWETILLTPSKEKAEYSAGIINDLKLTATVALRSQWKGIVEATPWGPVMGNWWAYEYANALDKTSVSNEQNIVRMRLEKFDRVMVNAVLKSLERMGRDLAQMRGSMDEKLDPRLVDRRMKSRSPSHYWSSDHRWGPDWPIPPPSDETKEGMTNAVTAQVSPPPVP